MGRPIRMFEPDSIYFVTNRTLQGRLLMRPSEEVNAIVGGVLAEGIRRYRVEVFNLVFLSNHFHMVVKAPGGALSSFMQFVNNLIARKVGALHDWQGKFWHRRFSAEPILDQEALLGRMKYIFMHGVKEGLVDQHDGWPGLTACPELCENRLRTFGWPGRVASKEAGPPLTISRIPGFESASSAEYAAMMRELCEQAEREAGLERGTERSAGLKNVLNKHPHDRPAAPKLTRRPLCHSACLVAKQAFVETYRAFLDAYRQASALLRSGVQNVTLPLYAYPPPLPYAWSMQRHPPGALA